MQSARRMSGGLPVMISLFGWGKRMQKKQHGEMVDPTLALAEIGVLGLDGKGTIVFCNEKMVHILEQVIGRKTTHKRVINRPLAEVLGLTLSKSVIGHSLIWKEEVSGRRIRVDENNLLVSTLLMWSANRQTLLGCIGYYIPYVPDSSQECTETAQYVVERMLRERGYPVTGWVSHLSVEHALQLQECLSRNSHTIPNPRHCAFAAQCAFNPVYGCFSLERRRFYRVPITIPLKVFIKADVYGETVNGSLATKFCEGQTIDLSLGGVCLQSAIQFPTGIILCLDFLLPTPVQLQGQVMWNRRGESGQWEHGIRFVTLGKEEKALILRLISSRVPAVKRENTNSIEQDIVLPSDIVVIRAVALLLRFLKAKDRDTFVHSLRTASIARRLGRALQLSEEELRLLRYAAVLHDLGKLEIEPSILKSTAVLGPEQMRTLRNHAIYGARLVDSYQPLRILTNIIRHHHERFDGQGYPDGLAGEDIPYLSRILTVSDSIDAMAHPRPYRRSPLEKQQILNVLDQESGYQFDPRIATAAMELLSAGKLLRESQLNRSRC